VTLNLDRLCANAEEIVARCGVPLIAVVKANAYEHGIEAVARALAGVAEGFYVFDLAEATRANLKQFGRPIIALLGDSDDPRDYLDAGVRPCVWTTRRAAALRAANPVLSVDTGQQRFACAPQEIESVLEAGACDEAMTHASTLEQAMRFGKLMAGRALRLHAAGTSLLDAPAARFDAVRPGLALYEAVARVSAPLVEARASAGPVGYSGFRCARHGVILAGYAQGLRTGPCLLAGQPRRIREVGMQSAFIELEAGDKVGDEIVLLGDGLTAAQLAGAWRVTPQQVLCQLAGSARLA
jgi:alanine racemase